MRVGKHSVASRMLGLSAIRRDLSDKNAETLVAVDFYSSSLIAIDRDSRTRHRFAEWPNFLKMFATRWMAKDLAPRARFELATLRLTAECSTDELPGIRTGRNRSSVSEASLAKRTRECQRTRRFASQLPPPIVLT